MRTKNAEESKRFIIVSIFLLTAILIYSNLLAGPESENIVIISVDTLRADHLGCYGYPLPTSPNIDSLSKDGVLFSRCYTLTPLTTASFSTMLTSLPPQKHGAKRNGLSIFPNVKTLTYYLKRYGYRTAAVISNGALRKTGAGLHENFDYYYGIFTKRRWWGLMNPEGEADSVTDKAISWINKHKKKRFFLWVHYTDPHAPYVAHERFDFSYKKVPASLYAPGTRMDKIKRYDSEVAYTDYYIGQLLEKLKNEKLYENSLILLHSDHGESFGEHGYFRHGRKLYNACLHVPLIIKLPGNRFENTSRGGNVCLLDVAPTILNALNLLEPDWMEGLPLFSRSTRLDNREIVVQAYAGKVHFRRKSKKFHLKVEPIRYGVIKGSTKLIYNKKTRTYEAYSLTEDPFETGNLVLKNPLSIAGMKNILIQRIDHITAYIEINGTYRRNRNAVSRDDMRLLTSRGYGD